MPRACTGEKIIKNGHIYNKSNGRLAYDPELHFNHGKPFTTKDLSYLCKMVGSMKVNQISLAIGRTHTTCLSKLHQLRKSGEFEYFRKLDI